MLGVLKKLFSDMSAEAAPKFADNDYRLAAAALLIHVMAVDGRITPVERSKLHALLKSRFELSDAEAGELIEAAIAADQDAIDMYRFTSLLNRSLDDEGRRRIVEMMWQIVYADGRLNEFEDNVIWRAADLLHVPARDRVALRRQVARDSIDDEVPG